MTALGAAGSSRSVAAWASAPFAQHVWARVGVLVADSKHTLGLEVGGGLEVALGGASSLTPGLRYRRFEPTVRFGGAKSVDHALRCHVRRWHGTEVRTLRYRGRTARATRIVARSCAGRTEDR